MMHPIDCKPLLHNQQVIFKREVIRELFAVNSLDLINSYHIEDIISMGDADGWHGQMVSVYFWRIAFFKDLQLVGVTYRKMENI